MVYENRYSKSNHGVKIYRGTLLSISDCLSFISLLHISNLLETNKNTICLKPHFEFALIFELLSQKFCKDSYAKTPFFLRYV